MQKSTFFFFFLLRSTPTSLYFRCVFFKCITSDGMAKYFGAAVIIQVAHFIIMPSFYITLYLPSENEFTENRPSSWLFKDGKDILSKWVFPHRKNTSKSRTISGQGYRGGIDGLLHVSSWKRRVWGKDLGAARLLGTLLLRAGGKHRRTES